MAIKPRLMRNSSHRFQRKMGFKPIRLLARFGAFSHGNNSQVEDSLGASPFKSCISDHSSHDFSIFSSPPMSSSSARKIVYASGRDQVADDFYTVLLSNVRSAAPDLPMDPVVFRALLLCILASGGKNLLLRSYDEDITLVQNIAALVSARFCYLAPGRHVSTP